ncbi:helix-turn-helix domain-containing protein [Conexibacter sp. S30A1]|uniref:helix-turn-helix domain-containing protein n=1 Tax=Conexibacter sp. S30A1 TaxID=2937800 RepID=UPI00200DF817|nr:helix-turn-helix domain-containing protein [Conexibacter sp. S30A1]
MTITDAELLTVDETAALLKVNAQTVRNWIDRGELPALRVGGRRVRIQRSVLEAFIGAELAKSGSEPPASVADSALPGQLLTDTQDGDDRVIGGDDLGYERPNDQSPLQRAPVALGTAARKRNRGHGGGWWCVARL